MDGLRFESLTRIVDAVSTRRIALRSALAGAAASGVAAVGLTSSSSDTEAKKKKKKCKKCKPLDADELCDTNKQCCTNETNRACAVAENASSGDRTCCGSLNAVCGGIDENDDTVAPFCCAEFACNVTVPNVEGTCQPATLML
jgi:hypothetical protein